MKFGISLSGLLQHTGDGDMVKRFGDVLSLVRLARNLGFDYVYAGQHFLSYPYQTMQPLVSLARLAAETGDMEMVSTILVPFAHPVTLAEDIATLDVVAGGRFIMAAALGYRDEEMQAFAVDPKQRVPRMMETLELVRLLWSGEEVRFHGRFFDVEADRIGVLPIRKPHPPIWMAANNDRAVERAAQHGFPWFINPHAKYETIAGQVDLYRRIWAAAGRGTVQTLPMARELFTARTRAEALRIAQPYMAGKYETYAQWGQDKALPGQESFHIGFDELSSGRFIIGDVDDCTRTLAKFRDLGVTHATLRMGWPGMPRAEVAACMELVAGEVVPSLR